MIYAALYTIALPSVRLSVRLSHAGIVPERIQLRSRRLHHRGHDY